MCIQGIKLTDFVLRQFNEDFNGTKITKLTASDFENKLNKLVDNKEFQLFDGYADFCKLITVDNFVNIKTGTAPITDSNKSNLVSEYKARKEGELAILSRHLELKESDIPVATSLVIVLYSKEQIEKESQDSSFVFDGSWGIVNIMAQMQPIPEPMTPITMMRNALGVEEGGSGVSLNKEEYNKSVEFWSQNAIVKQY